MASFFVKSQSKDIIAVEPFLRTLDKASTLPQLTVSYWYRLIQRKLVESKGY